MKVFFDTNVWLSAILFSGLCAELLLLCVEEGHTVLTSPLVREEAMAVLKEKFPRHSDASALFDANWSVAQEVSDVAAPQDDNDARLVAAAARSGADIFVTGDVRVQGWERAETMRIVTPRQVWAILFAPAQKFISPERIPIRKDTYPWWHRAGWRQARRWWALQPTRAVGRGLS